MTDILEAPAELTLAKYTDVGLTTPTARFDFSRGDEAVEMARALEKTLVEKMRANSGLGLAANQLGIDAAAFAMNVVPAQVVFNPRIVDMTEAGDVQEEACLSFPGIVAKVWRANAIRVRFQTSDGVIHTEKFSGMTARVFQHEYDHTRGVVFFDHLQPVALAMALKRSQKRGFTYAAGTLKKVIEASRANRA